MIASKDHYNQGASLPTGLVSPAALYWLLRTTFLKKREKQSDTQVQTTEVSLGLN